MLDLQPALGHGCLVTAAAIMRKSAVMSAGNFNEGLRHSEDRDLGERLLKGGFDIIIDPDLQALLLVKDDLWQTYERYWRWHAGYGDRAGRFAYLRQIIYSAKVMAVKDLKEGDLLSAAISLISPHYQFSRSLLCQPPSSPDIAKT